MTSGKSGLAADSQQMATNSGSSNPPTPTSALATTAAMGHPDIEPNQPEMETPIEKVVENEGKEEEMVEGPLKNEEEAQMNGPKKQQQQQRPEEYAEGLWEAEPFYYCTNGPTTANRGQQQFLSQPFDQMDAGEDRRQKRGVVYKQRENLGSANEFECFQSHEGIIYRIGDQVFVESNREEPWLIGCIVSLKMKKRDQLLVKLIRYYRPNDVPELSFSLITQARIEEGHYHQSSPGNNPLGPQQPHSHNSRELFSSESSLLFHVSALRGKCSVKLVKDLRAAHAEIDLNDPDSFFNCLNFNQESGRLASVQMSIRVGTAYQADVPSCSTSSLSDDPDRDELLYRPGYLCAETEQKYIKMTRAFRTFTLMNNKRITMLEKSARTGDLLLDDAVTNLHRSGYNIVDAVETMQAIDKHLTSDSSFMSVEDVKKFGKGIKQYGKNFNKINKELLPNHRREQLVAFYYLWKKSRDATRPKPLSNAKRNQVVAAVGRRSKNGQNGWNGTIGGGGGNGQFGNAAFGRVGTGEVAEGAQMNGGGQTDAKMDNPESLIPPLEDLVDYASASEAETDLLEQQPSGSGRACHHCFSSRSKDWHHAGRHCLLMCTDCRIFYKKYGQLRPVDRPCTVPPCLLASSRQESNEEEDENEEPATMGNRIRTRGALAGRQHRPRRTPSSLEVGTEQRLRGTPQKLTDEEEQQQQRRSTPLRNSAGKSGRKRGFRTGEMDGSTPTPTPPKAKRQKKNAESPTSTTACSRTPSPLENGEMAETGNNKKKTTKKMGKEGQILKKANANEGKTTPPPNSVKSSQNAPGTVSPCSSEPSSSSNVPSSANNSSGNSPQEMGGNEMKEKGGMGKLEPKEEEEGGGYNAPKNGPTIIGKKPVAKVEPLDTKQGIKGEGALEEKPKEETPTIICVDSSEEDGEDLVEAGECEQDKGPLGESDSTEIYRTLEGKINHKGEVIMPEGRTILERRLRRTSGLTCSRTDIAFVEPPERAKYNQQKKEKEKQKKEQEKINKQMAANNQQKMQQQSQMGMGAKKMEMPAEFGPVSAAATAVHPMAAALLMNGLGPGPHLPHQAQMPIPSSGPSTSSQQPLIPPTPISHQSLAAIVNGAQHPGAAISTAANHPLLTPAAASMNPAALFQQQQHEQALVMQQMQMVMERGYMQQLQAMLQQPSLAGQQQQMMQMLVTLGHQQEQKQLMEQLQRQQKQQQQQQAMPPQRPQTAMHLNGQHHPSTSHAHHPPSAVPHHQLINGLANPHHTMGGHKLSTGNAPPAHLAQQQHPHQPMKDSAAAQQQAAAAAAMMSQLFGGAGGFQQQQENHQNQQQQQQAATLLALQQQQQRLAAAQQNSNQSNSTGTTASNQQQNAAAQHLLNAQSAAHLQFQQQNQQHQNAANLAAAAEMAALTAAIQQQNGSNQQQQQIQQLMAAVLANGGLPGNEQRALEEQIKMHILGQQHQQMVAAAAAAAQQVAQQQAAATQQQNQQQQLLAALTAFGVPAAGAEQLMAQAMGQQQQMQQNQQQQPATSSHQQFQQQLQQVMAMHQSPQQAHQQHNQISQQQMEMFRRMYHPAAEHRR